MNKSAFKWICAGLVVLGSAGFLLLGGTEAQVVGIVSGVVAVIGIVAGVIAIIKKA